MEFDLTLLAVQMLTFLAASFIVWKAGGKKLLAVLDARKQSVSEGMAGIERERAKAAALRAEYEAACAGIGLKRAKLLEEAREEAAGIIARGKEDAAREAAAILAQARERMDFELLKARESLRDLSVELGMAAAERILRENMTGELDSAVVAAFLERLEQDAGPHCG